MNTYEASIWRSVYHSGRFSHTAIREQLIHALNEKLAIKKITLQPIKTWGKEPHIIEAKEERIYSLRKTGTVVIKPFYVYSDGRRPVPIKKGAPK